MQRCKCDIQLGGSMTSVTADKTVTVPELAILRHLHGADSVSNIVPFEWIEDWGVEDDAEERERLFATYESVARIEDRGFIERLFPAMQPLPRALRQIGIDARAAAAALRAKAEKQIEAAKKMEETQAKAGFTSDTDDDRGELPAVLRGGRGVKSAIDRVTEKS